MKKEEDKLLSSSYDGIQEYDNDLPRWWVYLFYLTVIFGVGYWAYYDIFKLGRSSEQIITDEMEQHKSLLAVASNQVEQVALASIVKNEETLKKGSEIFSSKCAACHGQNGEGLIGPNLTDEYWIQGGSLDEIKHVILKGVLDKGMLPWEGQLSNDEINSVTAYVWSLYGSNPPNAKQAQGDKVERHDP